MITATFEDDASNTYENNSTKLTKELLNIYLLADALLYL
jgi:hypothetical protein